MTPSRMHTSRALLARDRRPSLIRFGEFDMPTFVAEKTTEGAPVKPPRPIKMHVQARTLLPQTLAKASAGCTVSSAEGPPPTKAPPPERSTPRLGGPRRVAASPDALRPPPPERSTPRLGGPRPTPPAGANGTAEDADDTLLIKRRKDQLVARAATDPDENLYGIVGSNTHRRLQLAADENARRIWAAAVAGQKRRPRPARTFDTRWIPTALFAAAIIIVVFGFWLWNHKAERSASLPQVTVGALPAQNGAPQDARGEPSADLNQDARSASSDSKLPRADGDRAPAQDVPAAQGEPRGSDDATRASNEPAGPSAKPASRSTSSGKPRPKSGPKKASEQRIFTDAPF